MTQEGQTIAFRDFRDKVQEMLTTHEYVWDASLLFQALLDSRNIAFIHEKANSFCVADGLLKIELDAARPHWETGVDSRDTQILVRAALHGMLPSAALSSTADYRECLAAANKHAIQSLQAKWTAEILDMRSAFATQRKDVHRYRDRPEFIRPTVLQTNKTRRKHLLAGRTPSTVLMAPQQTIDPAMWYEH